MLRQRLIVVIIMLPIITWLVAMGGVLYTAVIVLAVGLAAWEYWHMFKKGGYRPSAVGTIGGAMLLSLHAYLDFLPLEVLVAILLMGVMLIHVLDFERGHKTAAIGFGVTLGGALYWGLLGGYLINLRQLPEGMWWFLLVIPAAWASDLGGYVAGHCFGKHAMAPRLSPKKTWEGYAGGVIFGLACTALLGAIWHLRADTVTWQAGFWIGGVIALLSPIGDLGASMFKRTFDLKDSSKLIPGHGGVMDRIDTWLWAATLGYFMIVIFF